jgi:hypothetical protein
MFFVWRRPHADGSGIPHLNGQFYSGSEISLGVDLENLLLVLGLLKDMVRVESSPSTFLNNANCEG